MSAVEVRGLTKTYLGKPPVQALRGLNLDVASKSLLAVLGPSGCGKTTLLRAIAGFESADSGSIVIDGRPVVGPGLDVAPERRRVGIVPQEGALFPHLDVASNVSFGLRGSSRVDSRARVAEMLELVGLGGFERRRPDELSGGQQQRVALARALAPGPALVLLDEPFAALDSTLRTTLRAEVAAMLSHTGTTTVLVTHDQTEALTMADSIAVMRNGEIVQSGSPQAVYSFPVDIETAGFLGDAVLLPGDAASDSVTCALGTLDSNVAATGPVMVMLRPEQIVLSPDSPNKALVQSVSFHGHDALVTLECDGHMILARWLSMSLPAVGDTVGIGVTGRASVFAR
jgi:iron(III) transport system ATP-binding protein